MYERNKGIYIYTYLYEYIVGTGQDLLKPVNHRSCSILGISQNFGSSTGQISHIQRIIIIEVIEVFDTKWGYGASQDLWRTGFKAISDEG